ncbi:HAD-IA family hydrolase [Granulosicoccaceae sp. 1_MG-2023]|nr:HAD-IA family hydrolase [Granulosicoccaceae sp. 1_MG-2023]
MIEAMLFDLDGTLVDTAPDLIGALNAMLRDRGLAEKPAAQIRPVVSAGANAIIAAGFGLAPDSTEVADLREPYLAYYRDNLSACSRLFAGMGDVLNTLEQKQISWGVVTNKPAFLTDPLMAELGLAERCCAIISADTTPFKKPHPEPLFEACRRARLKPENCVYVGDDRRDIIAGNAAGMTTLAAQWGYFPADDGPADWPADGVVARPAELLNWL